MPRMDTKTATVDGFTKYLDENLVEDGGMKPETSTRLVSDDCEVGANIHGTEVDTSNVLHQVSNIAVTYCAERGADGAASYQMIYKISDTPPIFMLIFYALQQGLLAIAGPLTVTVIVSEVTCAQKDEYIQTQILSASIFMTGLATFMVTTFGVRLPIFQTAEYSYLLPLMLMSASDEWRCPATFEDTNPADNTTIIMARIDNTTTVPARDVILAKLSKLNGSLMLVGAIHFIIGFTGLVGIIMRFIGPVTIVPAIMLAAMLLNKVIVKMSELNWTVAILTSAINFTLSLSLAKRKTPIPTWSRRRGFYILWYPFHQSFSILLSMIFGWTLSVIMMAAGALTDDPKSPHYLARPDARSYVITQTDWFTAPYPGKFGLFSVSIAAIISSLGSTFVSVLDSIGDYSTCARVCRVPRPPRSAYNRGIAVEGLMNILGGAMGCCHNTVSSSGNIGAMSVTQVASRRVFQCCGIVYILLAFFGKFGAAFITMPPPVLGGVSFLASGLFIGFVMSVLQTIDLNSNRNLAVIGTALMLGLMLPDWVSKSPEAINTGNNNMDNFLRALLSNPPVVGGVYACFMDNILPGSLLERGLLQQMKELEENDVKLSTQTHEDAPDMYRIPFIPQAFYKLKFVKYIPVFDYTGK
ncbi:hypothetical protein BsWGS_01033 [Bradybaena similaris]